MGVVVHVAVAVAASAGSAGVIVAVRVWPSTVRARLWRPVPLSAAWAWTLTSPRTWAAAGGPWTPGVGARSSWTIRPSAPREVSPWPPWVVAKTSSVVTASGVRVIDAVKAPVASAVTVRGAGTSLTKRSTRAPGSVVPVTSTGDWLVMAGALTVGAGGARNRRT